MITVHKLCLAFGTQKIFDEVSFAVNQNQRIGLVGRNGSGKSTLLKLIAGYDQPDSGTISKAKNKTIAYLPQEVVLSSDKSIVQETFSTFENMYLLQEEAKKLEPLLEKHGASTDQKIIDRYVHIQEELVEFDADAALAQTKKILMGLGFKQEQFEKPVDTLSVGWKMRVVLAKLLLKKADFYLFDEPTNHLDIVAKDWFLNFLNNSDFGFMIVCHERYALDKLTDNILELEIGKATIYSGNFSKYEKEKEHRLAILKRAHRQQQEEIKRRMRTIERFKAKSSKASMAQSMLKAVQKIEPIVLPPELKTMVFKFPPIQRAGRIALKVQNVAHRFRDRQIFKNANFEVERGQKIAIVAPNGVGKTTLFNLIVNKLPLQTGSIELGYNVRTAIFDQDQTKALDLTRTVLDNIEDRCPAESRPKVRSFLGAFLFSGDDVEKKVGVLSGGEKNRVGMINVLLQNANVMLLDEPTNHLDIPSKEILLNALNQYPGTLLFVSHDHDFINKLATHIIDLNADGTVLYEGNYEEYLYQKNINSGLQTSTAFSDKNSNKTKKASSSNKDGRNKPPRKSKEEQKKIKALERKITKLEKEIEDVGQSFGYIAYGTQKYTDAEQNLENLKQKLKVLMSEWESLQR